MSGSGLKVDLCCFLQLFQRKSGHSLGLEVLVVGCTEDALRFTLNTYKISRFFSLFARHDFRKVRRNIFTLNTLIFLIDALFIYWQILKHIDASIYVHVRSLVRNVSCWRDAVEG